MLPTLNHGGVCVCEWVHLNKILRQQEEGKADKNAQSSCGNVGNEVTLQSAVTYFEARRLWLAWETLFVLAQEPS